MTGVAIVAGVVGLGQDRVGELALTSPGICGEN